MEFKKIGGVKVPASCVIELGSVIGNYTKIWHFSHIMPSAVIGNNCIIGDYCFIAGVVGDGCKIQNNVSIFKGVILEDDVFVGPSAVFTNVLLPRAFIEQKQVFEPTHVHKGVAIGAGAVIVCGITIGHYAFIGAGAVVTRNILPYAMVYGNPAKMQGWICKKGHKMRERHRECPNCGVKND